MENINVKWQTLIKMKGYVFSFVFLSLSPQQHKSDKEERGPNHTHCLEGGENVVLVSADESGRCLVRCAGQLGSGAHGHVSR